MKEEVASLSNSLSLHCFSSDMIRLFRASFPGGELGTQVIALLGSSSSGSGTTHLKVVCSLEPGSVSHCALYVSCLS